MKEDIHCISNLLQEQLHVLHRFTQKHVYKKRKYAQSDITKTVKTKLGASTRLPGNLFLDMASSLKIKTYLTFTHSQS